MVAARLSIPADRNEIQRQAAQKVAAVLRSVREDLRF
jgi:hypothetical protein